MFAPDLSVGEMMFGDSRPAAIPAFVPWEPPRPLGPDAFHGVVGDVTRAIAPYSEAHEAAILFQLLVAAGSAAGRGPFVRIAGGEHRLNLFTAIVGASGQGRKGTSLSYVKQLMTLASPTWMANHQAKGMESRQALVRRLAGMDEWMMLEEPELSGVLRNSHRLSASLREAWGSSAMESTRRSESILVRAPHVSLIGHITEDELLDTLRRGERFNGFANRFLWSLSGRVRVLPMGGGLPPALVTQLAQNLQAAIQAAASLGELTHDAEALALWDRVYTSMAVAPASEAGPVLDRQDAQVLRLSALYAALDGTASIKVEHIRAAVAVWDYAKASAERLFGGAGRLERRITKVLGEHGPQPRSVIRNLCGRSVAVEDMDRALERLKVAGLVSMTMRFTTGRPAETWALVPARSTLS